MMMMGGVSSRGGSREVDRFMVIVQLKMEDVCILRNVIEILKWRKSNQDKKMKASLSFQAPNGIGIIA